MSGLYKTCLALTIVGAVNWLLIGLFNWNLVGAIFGGDMSVISRIIYTIVGICGLVCLGIYNRDLRSSRAYDRDLRTDRDVHETDTDIRRAA